MRSSSLLVVALVTLLSVPAAAEPPGEWADYFAGPVGHLLTKAEAKQWKALTTAEEAEAFVELFWARRDPDLGTAANEFRVDFEARVAAADQQFAFGETRGAMSDRGRVLILLGRPDGLDNRPAGAVVDLGSSSMADRGAPGQTETSGAYQDRGATELWQYDAGALPVKVGQEYVNAVFRETRVGMDDYVLDRSLRDNAWVMKLLADLPEAFLLHPELDEVPRIGLVAGQPAASDDQLAWLDAGGPWPEGAAVVAQHALLPGPEHLAWVHVRLPQAVGAPSVAAGRLSEAGSGEEVGSFAMPVEPFAIGAEQAVELALPISPGAWRLELALADGGRPTAVKTVELEAEAAPEEGAAISPFTWGTAVEEVHEAELGDPFNVGGWHITPHLGTTFAADDSINYMCYVFDLDAEEPPQLRWTLTVNLDGTRVTRTPAQLAQLSELAPGLWMFGNGVPAAAFRDPGEYLLEVTLRGGSGGPRREVEIPFVVE
jgi:GWxTD domain-containing protein